MTSALLVALVILAGATNNSIAPGETWWDLNLPEILAHLPQIIARLPEIINSLLPHLPAIIENLPNIIGNIPDIIGSIPGVNLPEIIPALPGNLPAIIAGILEILDDLSNIISNINWPSIIALFPDVSIEDVIANIPDIIANLPGIIANLPDIIAHLPELIDQLPEIIASFPNIDWPAIIDSLPEVDSDPGVLAVIEQYPSLVQMECNMNGVWTLCCAGSILNAGYVLTAARCVSGVLFTPAQRQIRAGTTWRSRGGELFPVSYAVTHPSFGENGREADIACVRVTGNFVYGPYIQRIGIAADDVVIPANTPVSHAGWGSTAHGRVITNDQLQWVIFTTIDNSVCAEIFERRIVPQTVTENMVCYGRPLTGGRKNDLRDTGSPIYMQGAVVGVQIFGSYFNNSVPLVATAVSPYSQWVVNTAV